MKTKLALLAIAIFCFFSCTEYSSEFPLADSSKSYPKEEVFGTWDYIWSSEGEDDPHKLLIYKDNPKEYLVLFVPENPDDSDDIIVMKSHLTKIGKNEFSNSRLLSDRLSDDENEFVIHKLVIKNDTLVLSGIPAKLLESLDIDFLSQQEHYDFIKENADNLPFWTIRYEYKRSGGEELNAGR